MKTLVKTVDDKGVLDHIIARLLPVLTSLRAQQQIATEPDKDFLVKDTVAPTQKNETQIRFFRTTGTAGRKRTKHPMTYMVYVPSKLAHYSCTLFILRHDF